ncbi:unnamed protein product [Brassica rapa subsp. narinosa]
MAQTTTVIFILATLLVPATVVSGQTPPSPVAPSPTINEAMNCAAGLTVCLPAFAQGGTPSKECCTAVKTQQSCLCGFIKAPVLVVPFNITAFSALISKSCGINTDLNLCSETPAHAPLPHMTAPPSGTPKTDKDAASKPAETGLDFFTEDHDHTSLGTCLASDFGSYSTKPSRTVSRYDHIACRDVACYRLGASYRTQFLSRLPFHSCDERIAVAVAVPLILLDLSLLSGIVSVFVFHVDFGFGCFVLFKLVKMGDYTIQISSRLINQLAEGDNQPKRKAKKTKPKVSPQSNADQAKTHHDAEKPKPIAELPTQPPFFFPVPQQAAANTELESIKSILREGEKVLEKVERQERSIVHEVTERAKDLREKEFKIPESKPMPCSSDHQAWKKCYEENVDNPLKCSSLVMRFQDCARRFRQQVSSKET